MSQECHGNTTSNTSTLFRLFLLYNHVVRFDTILLLLIPCSLIVVILGELAIGIGGVAREPLHIWFDPGLQQQLARLRSTTNGTHDANEGTESTIRSLLVAQPWSPMRWCDAAELHEDSGNADLAGRFFDQAVRLGGSMPLVWIRKANFHWRQGDMPLALSAYRMAVGVPSPYRTAVFVALDGLGESPSKLFDKVLSADKLAAEGYIRHQIRNKRYGNVQNLWDSFAQKFGENRRLASEVSMALWIAGEHRSAYRVWSAPLSQDSHGDFLLANQSIGFRGQWLPTPFSWRCDGCLADIRLDRRSDSDGDLSLVFPANLNRRFDGLKRTTLLEPGKYEVQFRWELRGAKGRGGPVVVVRDATMRSSIFGQSEEFTDSDSEQKASIPFTLQRQTFVEFAITQNPFEDSPFNQKAVLRIDSPELRTLPLGASQSASTKTQ